MIRLSPKVVTPGKRLPYDVIDQWGKVLLLRGESIADETQASMLRHEGYRSQHITKYASPFTGMAHLAQQLATLDNELPVSAELTVWLLRVSALVRELIDLADSDPDASFAGIHLEVRQPYLVVHHLMAALITARLAFSRGADRAQRFAMTAAALTHDIGTLSYRTQLDDAENLSPELRARVLHHPRDGVEMLRKAGVTDPLWLDIVRDHHEYLDGTGYAGKRGDDISLGARIVVIADAYSAMLRPRPYRDRMLASTALEQLISPEMHRYDSDLVERLIWDQGFYPPGSLIRLANREVAVVVRNTPGLLDSPVVAAITESHGRPLAKPYLRDTRQAAYAIADQLDPALALRASKHIEQCWSNDYAMILKA